MGTVVREDRKEWMKTGLGRHSVDGMAPATTAKHSSLEFNISCINYHYLCVQTGTHGCTCTRT